MFKIEEEILDESCETEVSSQHTDSDECSCPDCQKGKKHHVQILDMDSLYLLSLEGKAR